MSELTLSLKTQLFRSAAKSVFDAEEAVTKCLAEKETCRTALFEEYVRSGLVSPHSADFVGDQPASSTFSGTLVAIQHDVWDGKYRPRHVDFQGKLLTDTPTLAYVKPNDSFLICVKLLLTTERCEKNLAPRLGKEVTALNCQLNAKCLDFVHLKARESEERELEAAKGEAFSFFAKETARTWPEGASFYPCFFENGSFLKDV